MASVTKDVLSWLKTWFHTKSEIASLLLGKSDVGHEHETTEMVETTALGNLELTSGATQQEINIAINSKISGGGGSTGNSSLTCLTDLDVDALNEELFVTGCDGKLITGVEKTGTSGNVDTYTITFSDNSTFDFTVTNATDGVVTHSHGNLSSDGKVSNANTGNFTYFVGLGSSNNNLYKASKLKANQLVDTTAHSNIGSSANATQNTINSAIDTKFANIDYNDLLNKPNIPQGAVVDDDINGVSRNPVQNRIIYEALSEKLESSDITFGFDSTNKELYMEIS